MSKAFSLKILTAASLPTVTLAIALKRMAAIS